MTTSTWYAHLKKPRWAPKPPVFSTVWSLLYPIIALTYGFVFYQAYRGHVAWAITMPFSINLIANLLFTPIQFGLKNNFIAAVDILFVLVSIILTMVAIAPTHPWVAYAQIPYLIWVIIATVLQLEIVYLNFRR